MLQPNLENQDEDNYELIISRRNFLRNFACGGAALAGLATPTLGHASKSRYPVAKALALHNINTGEKLKLTYFEKGRYIKPALREINFVLRDYRTGDVHPIDLDLLDQLHDLRLMLGAANRPFHVVSGYRSPLTNLRLHQESNGVANNSLHILGKAIDIRIEGMDCRRIRNAALALHRGGVGYYGDSNFVHLDTGKIRTW